MGQVTRSRHAGRLGWWFQAQEPARPKKSERTEIYLRLLLHGDTGAIAWGWHTAAELSSWRVARSDQGDWTLTATVVRVDPVYLRQTHPTLLFTAPKVQGPPWCWPVLEVGLTGNRIHARLGPVEF